MNKEIFNPDYMVRFPQFGQPMVLLSLMACLLTAGVLGWIWFKRRYWFVQPSLLMISFYHVRIQWSSLYFMEWAEQHYQHPWNFVLLTQFLPIAYLLVAIPLSLFKDNSLKEFSTELRKQLCGPYAWPRGIMYISLAVGISVLAVFFTFLPFRNTALYYFFTDPTQINVARSITWRGMDSRILMYFFSWNVSIFGPFLVFGSVYFFVDRLNRWKGTLLTIVFFCVGFIAMSISGQRSGPGMAVLLMIAAYYCGKRCKPSPIMLMIGCILVLSVPALISIRREGRDWSLEKQIYYTQTMLVNRVLTVPVTTGALYFYDAEVNGFSGAAGFRPLAILMGVELERLPYRIGKEYSYYGTEHTFVNTAAIFEYYKIMGLFAIPFTLVGLLCFDLFLLFFRSSLIAHLPFVVFFAFKAISFGSSSLTVILVTEGCWMMPFLALLCRIPAVDNAVVSSTAQAQSLYERRPARSGR